MIRKHINVANKYKNTSLDFKFWPYTKKTIRLNNFIIEYSRCSSFEFVDVKISENKNTYIAYVNLANDSRFNLDFAKPQNSISRIESEEYKERKSWIGMGGLVINWYLHQTTLVKIIKVVKNVKS